jgi:hypothetical protein
LQSSVRCITYIAGAPVISINPDTHKITTMILKIINTVTLFPLHRNWRHPVKYIITNDIRGIHRGEARAAASSLVDNIRSRRVDTLSELIIGSTMPGCIFVRRVALIFPEKAQKKREAELK